VWTTQSLQVSEKALLVPGQRQLVYVAQQQLERVIAEEGRLTLAPMAGGGSIDDSGTAATAATAAAAAAPRLSAPKRGSWAVAGMALGVQRLPDHRALLRLLVTDRVAVQVRRVAASAELAECCALLWPGSQAAASPPACSAAAAGTQALSCPSPGLVLARAGVLRDRWAYMVRQGALQEHLAPAAGRTNGSSSSGQQAAGREVLTAVQQVQDAASELMQLLAQLAGSVSAAADAPGAGEGAGLAGKLVTHEAADELDHLATWCSAGAAASGDQDGSMVLPADGLLLERAWRLSFAPYAATGLAAVLSAPDVSGVARAAEVQEVLELTDLGQRLEAAAGAAQVLRQQLAARLSLETL
jgi:hypothetical protein